MKRLLSLLAAAVLLLPLSSSCKDVEVVATATVTILDPGNEAIFGPADFGPYRYYNLSGRELRNIVMTLTAPIAQRGFNTAMLHVEYYERIEGRFLQPDDFSVVWDEFERDFVIQEL
jgi:hypothetical protein